MDELADASYTSDTGVLSQNYDNEDQLTLKINIQVAGSGTYVVCYKLHDTDVWTIVPGGLRRGNPEFQITPDPNVEDTILK